MAEAPDLDRLVEQRDQTKLLQPDPSFDGVRRLGRLWQDVPWLLLYATVALICLMVSLWAFANGDPDTWGRVPRVPELRYWAYLIAANDGPVLVVSFIVSAMLGYLWISALQSYTRHAVYITIGSSVAVALASGIYMVVDSIDRGSVVERWLGWLTILLVSVLVFSAYRMRRRFEITVAVLAEAGRGVAANQSLFLLAFALVCAFGVFTLWWTNTVLYLYSIDPRIYADKHKAVNWMYLLTPFYFWTASLISAVFQTTVAGSIAAWYFGRSLHGSRERGNRVHSAFSRAAGKSIGSLAFASLILGSLNCVNFLLRRLRQAQRDKNRVLYFVIMAIECALSCVHHVVHVINRYAFVYIAMYGESLCVSASSVMHLLQRNLITAVFMDVVMEFVMFLGKLGGIMLSTFIALCVSDATDRPLGGMTLIMVGSIAYAVFDVYSRVLASAVDAVFVCYLEDLERNRDTKQYLMTADTHLLLQQHVDSQGSGGEGYTPLA